jgi:hypothetical protein
VLRRHFECIFTLHVHDYVGKHLSSGITSAASYRIRGSSCEQEWSAAELCGFYRWYENSNFASTRRHAASKVLRPQEGQLPDVPVNYCTCLALHHAGPVEGRRHDMAIFSYSGIEEDLAASLRINVIQYCIYGDSAYVLRVYLMVGFDGTDITPEQAAFNKAMSRSRVAVEWTFKDIKKYWNHAAYPQKRRAGLLLGFCMEPALLFGTFGRCLY